VAGAATAKEGEDEGGVVGGAPGGFWELESGVEGEGADVPPASSSTSSLSGEDSVRGLALRVVSSEFNKDGPPPASAFCGEFAVGVVAWPFRVGLESGCSTTRPLLIPLLVMLVLSLSPRLSSVDALLDVLSAGTEGASTRGSDDAVDSWSVLVPTFIILDSVDLRLDNGGMGAYSCADGMGGGKNGDPGDGKGDEEDSLLTATVSKGVSGSREERGEGKRRLVATDETTGLGDRPFVSGLMTAEVISGFLNQSRRDGRLLFGQRERNDADNAVQIVLAGANSPSLGVSCPDNRPGQPFRQTHPYQIPSNNYSSYRLLSLIPPHRFLRRPAGRLAQRPRLVTIIPFCNTPPTRPSYARSSWLSI
jgi:hypothetical protein